MDPKVTGAPGGNGCPLHQVPASAAAGKRPAVEYSAWEPPGSRLGADSEDGLTALFQGQHARHQHSPARFPGVPHSNLPPRCHHLFWNSAKAHVREFLPLHSVAPGGS